MLPLLSFGQTFWLAKFNNCCLYCAVLSYRCTRNYCCCDYTIDIDQKDKFTKTGISVEFVGEAQEEDAAVTAVVVGDIQLVYISPESLLCNPRFRNMLLSESYKRNLRALVVDEAHCVKLR